MTKLSDLSTAQLESIAELAGTSPAYLRHVSRGRRNASAETAAQVEAAADRMGLDIGRETMCQACKGCKYLKSVKMRGGVRK